MTSSTAGGITSLEEDLIRSFGANDFLLDVDTSLEKFGNLKLAQSVDDGIKKTNEVMKEANNDFYSRFRNLYNKPLTTPKGGKTQTVLAVDSFSNEKEKGIQQIIANTSKKKQDKKTEDLRRNPKRRLNLSRLLTEEIFCRSLEEDKNVPRDIIEQELALENDEKEFFRCPVPSLNDLPDDEEQLEKLLKSYITDIKPSWKRHKSGKPYRPGTKESVRNIEYRLADLRTGEDIEKAATNGEVSCRCPDAMEIDGDEATLQDINVKLDELKKNHKIARVTIKIRNAHQGVKESVDTKSKAQKHKGTPVLLTKFCLERVCEQVAKHPCLSSLKVENVPLSPPYQTMLVPSFAALRELKLIGNRLGDRGVKTICRYVWRSGRLRVLDLSDNRIGPGGVAELAVLLERRALLRMMEPDFFGVERITLDKNPIKYDGFVELLNAAGKDLWLKALDVRNCGLTRGGEEALKLVTRNKNLEVLDLRGNYFERIGDVAETVLKNCPPEQAQYKWYDGDSLKNYSS